MKQSLFLSTLSLAFGAFVSTGGCGGSFAGFVEDPEDAGVVRDSGPKDTGPNDSGRPGDSGGVVTNDAGIRDSGPPDVGPVEPPDAGDPGFEWVCASTVRYYGNATTGQPYATKVTCENGKANYCDVDGAGASCDPDDARGGQHFLCGDCAQTSQGQGWVVPAQVCGCQSSK